MLRWFAHVERRSVIVVVRKIYQMEESQIKRGRRRPKKIIRGWTDIGRPC